VKIKTLPDDFPHFLRRAEEDAPVPTWDQITRSLDGPNPDMIARVSNIVADTADEIQARGVWERWPPEYRRSMGLLIDKICHEGWLDCVGAATGVWDGGMFFRPLVSEGRTLAEILNSKPEYTRSSLRNGLAAWINSWNHRAWTKSWMENDSATVALHVGAFADGTMEAHFDLFNPLFTRGALVADVFSLPFIGSFNRQLFRLHNRWERSRYASVARRSANFYHLLADQVPLSF
jgi:hypothetical protein